MSLFNSILADSIGPNDFESNVSVGPVGHNNIVERTTANIGVSTIAADPYLGPLADNGGPTLTKALLSGSSAINAGDSIYAVDINNNPFTTDQRGFARFVTGAIDLGAFEFADFDFGDAPNGYPVTLAENGARHLATGPTLGATRDSEADGTHSANADADGADEDGVTAAGPLVVGQTTNTTINASAPGFVNAWADLTRDGDWDDPGEQFLTNFAVIAGDNVIPFSIPANFPLGPVVNRYRITSASVASPSPTGLLPDGEVEDYLGAIVEAPSLIVTTATDVVDPFDGLTSLREALAYAAVHSGDDTITFGDGSAVAGGTNFTDAAADTITLNGTELEIDSSVTIDGPGANLLTISGDDQSRVFYVTAGSSEVSGVTITGGFSSEIGGAIYTRAALTLRLSVVTDNHSESSGGAIFANADFNVIESTFSRNSAESNGGDIASQFGLTTIDRSAFLGSTSGRNGGSLSVDDDATGYVSNSTFFGNAARRYGGAFIASESLTIVNCTIVGNRADSDDSGGEWGGGVASEGTVLTMYNTIVAGNFRGTGTVSDNDGFVGYFATDNNLVGGDIAQIFILDGDGKPLLADNGGPTQTIALKPYSIAIHQGNNAFAIDDEGNPLAVDQRGIGFPRIVDGTVDIGAYESDYETPSLVVTTASDVSDPNDDLTSLREAITFANLNPGADSITFSSTLNGTPLLLDGTTFGDLAITDSVTITGNGGTNTIVDGDDSTRIFTINDGTATVQTVAITGVTLQHGNETFSGAIRNFEHLTLSDSNIINNAGYWGGAINNQGTLISTNNTFAENSSAHYGGAVLNTSTVFVSTNDTFTENTAVDARRGDLRYLRGDDHHDQHNDLRQLHWRIGRRHLRRQRLHGERHQQHGRLQRCDWGRRGAVDLWKHDERPEFHRRVEHQWCRRFRHRH